MHTAAQLYFNSIKDVVNGKRNNNNPVILFITVCRDINRLFEIYPNTMLPIFIIAIIPTHTHNHNGILNFGSSLIKAAVTNTMSAAVSASEPNFPTLFVFRAIVPSIMSLKPQRRYMI